MTRPASPRQHTTSPRPARSATRGSQPGRPAAVRRADPDLHDRPTDSGLDFRRPHSARVYGFLLGGKDNFATDRAFAEALLDRYPAAATAARANRDFHRRVVTHLARQGVEQFLDIGCGIPTLHTDTHQIAHAVNPQARVVYVDNDPLVLTHARALFVADRGAGAVTVVDADLRDPQRLLADAGLQAALDLTQPVAVLALTVLDGLPYTDARRAVQHLSTTLAYGSWIAVSHTTRDRCPPAPVGTPELSAAAVGFQPRRNATILRLLDGLDLVPADGLGTPGLVPVNQWRPDPRDDPADDIRIVGALAYIAPTCTHPPTAAPSGAANRCQEPSP